MPNRNTNENPADKKYNDEYFSGLKNTEKKGSFPGADGKSGIDGVRDAESSPGKGWKDSVVGVAGKATKGVAIFKRKSAGLAIGLTLIGFALVGVGGIAGPSLLLTHIKETLTGYLNDAAPAQGIRTNKILFMKFKNVKGGFAESSPGKCNITCKFSTVNDTMLNNLRAKGFEVETKDGEGLFKNRHTITSLTFPNGGATVTDGKSFSKEMSKPLNAVSFKKVFNSKTAYFLNSKFGQTLSRVFHLDKLPKLKSAVVDAVTGKVKSAKDSITASMHTALNIPEVDVNAPKKPTAMEKIKNNPAMAKVSTAIQNLKDFGGGITGKASNAIGAMCTTYDTTKGITTAVKAAKVAAFVGFTMLWFTSIDQNKAGDGDPDVMSQLGSQMTELDANGKSATDSNGLQIASFGNSGSAMTAEDQTYSAAPSSDVYKVLTVLVVALSLGGLIGATAAKNICKGSNNAVVGMGQTVAELAAECPEAIALAAGTGGAGIAVSAAECLLKKVAIDWFKQAAIAAAIGLAVTKVTEAIVGANMPQLDENTKGVALGDSLYTGSAQLLGGTSAAYGLKAGSKAEIKQYAIDTATIKKQEETIARYEAKDTPFDIYNQYSFLGSIVNSIGAANIYSSSSPVSLLGNILSIIPRSMATISNNVGAEADAKAAQYDNKCDDVALKGLGIDGDVFCNPSYVMSTSELDADPVATAQYMIDGKYVDEDTGEPITDTGSWTVDLLGGSVSATKNPYQLYLDNCANRTEPLGETSASIEDSDYEWKVGINCTQNTDMIKNFRIYTMDKAGSDTMDEDLSSVKGSGFSDSSSGSSSTPEATITPVNAPINGAAVICLDAGHPGAPGEPSGAGGEQAINLKVAQDVQKELESRGYKVVMTRTGTSGVALADRPQKCIDGKANFMYSFHADGTSRSAGYPYQIYMKTSRNQSATSKSYADTIEKAVAKEVAGISGLKNGGICMEGKCTALKSLQVFTGTDNGGIPAVMTEMVQLKNGHSALDDSSVRSKLVTGIANGIQSLFPIKNTGGVSHQLLL